jgi:hypothetical protein
VCPITNNTVQILFNKAACIITFNFETIKCKKNKQK